MNRKRESFMYKLYFGIVILLTVSINASEITSDVKQCLSFAEESQRLACYDNLHGYENKTTDKNLREKRAKRSTFSIQPHKPSYFMPISYNGSRNPIETEIGELLSDSSDDAEFDAVETKFQISFQMNLWDEVLGTDTRLMAAYTQVSYWQMYNSGLSSLFRETNYEPEVFLNRDSYIDLFGFKLINTSLGFVHQSNGRPSVLSRSWNRIFVQFILQKDNFIFSIKPWYRIEEDLEDDDNPDIDDYLGSYELGALYQWKEHEFTLMLRNLNGSTHHETYALGWLFPLNDDINFYLEYFHGYGENLIDYNYKSKSFGMGFTISDWIE